LFANCTTDISANDESNQMDYSNDIHDPNDLVPHTRALPSLSQPLSSEDPGYDSEEEYANHMASLDISDESKVSVSSIDTHMSKLRFQWNPILLRNQCGARSQAGTSTTWRTAAVASEVLRCRLSSHTLRSNLQGAILLGKSASLFIFMWASDEVLLS
jgi:hypothetical protein